MESKLKVIFLAAIALGIWVQVFQNASQSSMTRYVSVVNDVNVFDITPKPPVNDKPIDINIAAINGCKSAFYDESGSPEGGSFGRGGFGSNRFIYLPIHFRNN